MYKITMIFFQIAGLWLIFQLGTWGVGFFNLPIPGSVLGMLILFTLLSTGMVKEEWFSSASNLLLKHLAFFFIPIAVGLMEWGNLFWQYGQWLFLALLISALVSLLITGGLIQLLTLPVKNSFRKVE